MLDDLRIELGDIERHIVEDTRRRGIKKRKHYPKGKELIVYRDKIDSEQAETLRAFSKAFIKMAQDTDKELNRLLVFIPFASHYDEMIFTPEKEIRDAISALQNFSFGLRSLSDLYLARADKFDREGK